MEEPKLKKELSLVQLTYYGVGTIVGAGIYAVIGVVAGQAGYAVWVSFVLAAVAASFTALSYAELASALPKAGAEYVYLNQAFPKARAVPFLTGYFITVHGAATFATVTLAFAGYFTRFVSMPLVVTAYALLILTTAFNVSGIKRSSFINIAFTSAQILGLIMLVVAGMSSPNFGEVVSAARFDLGMEVFAATALVFYVFTGYEHMATLAEEAKNPKTIPYAFVFSLLFTTVIYLLIVFSALALATPEALGASDSPLALAASNRFPWMGIVIGIAALFATANVALSASLSVSRMMYGMAYSGDMPSALSRLNKQRSPWVAAVVIGAAVAVLIPFGEIKLVAGISSLGALLVFTLVNLAVIVLRYKQPELERPFKAPLRVGRFPLLPVCGILTSLLLVSQFEWKVYAAFAAAVALGMVAYWLTKGKPSIRTGAAPEELWSDSH